MAKKGKNRNESAIDGKNDIINENRNSNSLPEAETAGRGKKEKKKY